MVIKRCPDNSSLGLKSETITRSRRFNSNLSHSYNTRSRARMDAERNFGEEIDEVKGKMDEMVQAQNMMKDSLEDIKNVLALLAANHGGQQEDAGGQQEDVPPIGGGYRPIGNADYEGEGSNGPRFEQPQRPVFGQTDRGKNKTYEEWMEKIEEQLKTIRGADAHGSLRIEELCHATNVVIPKDFKVPDFSKYDESGNPRFHLVSYATKMAMWSKEDEFLICFFHESLTGPALEWYLELDLGRISKWTELADLFMDQYKFNVELAQTREQLGAMQKKKTEPFREYTIKWRGLAVQVQPKMTMPEMCSYFMGTLGTPYIGIMAEVAYKDFRELMDAGDRIEMLTKAGKLPVGEVDGNGTKKNVPQKKKENEVNQVHRQQWRSQQTSYDQTPAYQPNQRAPTHTRAQTNRRQNTFFPDLPPFPKLAISNAELFRQLADRHLLAPYLVRPFEGKLPPWYNPNHTCNYHMDVAGHSIEDCEQFKLAVRKLMACGKLEFEDDAQPDISKNPIPNHNREVSVVDVERSLVRRVFDLGMSMQHLFDVLRRNRYNIVAPTANAGHSIEDCWGYKARVQVLLNLGVIQAKKDKCDGEEIDMVEKVTLRISLLRDSNPERVTLKIRKPQPFAYESTHNVPWSYEVKVDAAGEASKVPMSKAAMAGEITRSGRCYGPPEGNTWKVGKGAEEKSGLVDEITEKDDEEFLKIMR
ncbi:PREDICTED: uncharacterized protein LOC109350566 [Lupinus angustifolius]|uniref:uncharacterized protein LOC109350566 n=1 Tax=Lupinus angustifolius TaxID=3871 RepID=UPI00092E4C00|nr:PREDICTED: uncharacterized protein LOC109350566 [Lupinus angustifolius]